MEELLEKILKEQIRQTKILQSIESKLEDNGVEIDLVVKELNQHQQRIYQAGGSRKSSVLNHDHTKALRKIGMTSTSDVSEPLESTHSFDEAFPEIAEQMKEQALNTDSRERLRRANAAYFDHLKRGGY